MRTAIETNELSKVFSQNIVALKSLSLSVKEGEIFSFLGPNGAGKTTTVRLLTTLLKPTSGSATVNGFSINENSVELRRNIGLLTDKPNLYLRLSARKNLLFFAKMYGLSHEEANRQITKMAAQFELIERLDSPTGSYSKGMKQKLGILRAMIHSPSILFLDEPTSGLDPIAQSNVRETIEKMAKELDATIFMTTHNLPEAERLADKIGVIDKGKLLVLGTTAELRSKLSRSNKLLIKCVNRASEVSRIIQGVKGVKSVQVLLNNKLEIEVSNFIDDTPEIVRSLVENKIGILEVRQTEKSLEDIYKQIMSVSTGGK
jgi:ABC-2 type transport system ATP-binding protein